MTQIALASSLNMFVATLIPWMSRYVYVYFWAMEGREDGRKKEREGEKKAGRE
jgi:hypothetical protein